MQSFGFSLLGVSFINSPISGMVVGTTLSASILLKVVFAS
jgi:hypothetical protein